ncbi:MAG: DUF4965 domain-containing protein [Lentisphaerae bacterium]|nr:DUF4965 domain-containing protein [Lentisphaerota bacterium]
MSIQECPSLRPPAVPLIACDPYFSVWSQADRLTDVETTHWTGKPHRLGLLARIDGAVVRLMGTAPAGAPALPQESVCVRPTTSVYAFQGRGVSVRVAFITPALPDEPDVLAWPVTYIVTRVQATDSRAHGVQLYFDAAGELTVNEPAETAVGGVTPVAGLTVVKAGAVKQAVLQKRGDDIRIDWGYLYVAAPAAEAAGCAFADRAALHFAFAEQGAAGVGGCPAASGPAGTLAAALAFDLGEVGEAAVERCIVAAYDDLYSIRYLEKNLRPYWRRNGWEAADLLTHAVRRFPELRRRCEAFDEELCVDLTRVGGEAFAQIAALAYRQCFAAGKFVADAAGRLLQFSKENHSNGCMATSDVFYPMAPQFLLFGPTLVKSFLVPFMDYAASPQWRFPFAPHDLGQYPHASGQIYGGGERSEKDQMPVEESGNLLLLIAALARMEGHADFAGRYWPQLEAWAEYLKAKGFDPEHQLCTDDFAGHLAHNVNLSAKAICALGAFAVLCEMRGQPDKAQEYRRLAEDFARRWVKEAADGDHFRLAFDRPGTWSQKYNLVWDRLLGLNLFPASVARTETDYYRKVQNPYGLPLDGRQAYTKLDWIIWSATLTGDRADFEALVAPVHRFLNKTPDRSPMTDWYFTDGARKQGFTARPVVGAVFLPLLYDMDIWQKYAGRAAVRAAD